MRRNKWIPMMAMVLILTGCGGGGSHSSSGNSGTSIPNDSNNEPPTQPLQQSLITRGNAAEHLRSSLRLIEENASLLYDASYAAQQAFLSHGEEENYFEEYTCPNADGVNTSEGNFSAAGDSGEIVITNEKCGRGYAFEYNGIIRITVSQIVHPFYPFPKDYTIKYESYEVYDRDENTRYIYNGTITGHPFDDSSIIATSNLTIEDAATGNYIKADDLTIFTNIPEMSGADIRFLGFSGTGAFSDLGTVDITTNTSTADALKITGANNTNILFSYLDAYDLFAKLDEDGDTVPDAYLHGHEREFFEDHGDNDNPVGGIDTTFSTDRDVPIGISLLSVTDPDYDFLDYSIEIIDSPPDSRLEWHIDDPLNLAITADLPGNYVFDLVVSDGNGGRLRKRVDMSVWYASPEVDLDQTSFQYSIGDLVKIDLSPSNMAEGPFSYSVSPFVPGMSISNDGILEWQIPDFGSFFPEINVDVTVLVSNPDQVGLEIPLSFSVTNPDAKQLVVHSPMNPSFTDENIHVGDFDNDGTSEILSTDHRNLIYTVECKNGEFTMDWMYPYDIDTSASGIDAVLPYDMDNDGYSEIFVQTNLQITVIDMRHNTVIASQNLSEYLGSEEKNIKLGHGILADDIDKDGSVELVALLRSDDMNYSQISSMAVVIDAVELNFLWKTPIVGVTDEMEIGNVDGDGAMEIVLSSGYVFDGYTQSVEWEYPGNFGWDIVVADIDGSGIDKIIAVQENALPVVYDAVLQTKSFISNDESYFYSQGSMTAADLDEDPEKEIIIADGNGKISAYDMDSGTLVEIWTVQIQDGSATGLSSGDIDQDGELELICEIKESGTSPFNVDRILMVLDPANLAIDFQKKIPDHYGPYIGGSYLTENNGKSWIVFAGTPTDVSSEGVRLLFMDPETGNISMGPQLTSDNIEYFDFCTADYDLDGTGEILFASRERYQDGFLGVYDPDTLAQKHFLTMDQFASIGFACQDINGDGHTDIAAEWDGIIHLYDPYNEVMLGSSDQVQPGWAPDIMIIRDLDGDGVPEIIAKSYKGMQIFNRSGSSYVAGKSYPFYDNKYDEDLLVDDIDGDGKLEIIAPDQRVFAYGHSTYNVMDANLDIIESFTVNGSISALAPSGNKDNTLLISTTGNDGSRVKLFNVANNNLLWKSPPLLGNVSRNGIHVLQNPETSKKQWIIATENAMYMIQ